MFFFSSQHVLYPTVVVLLVFFTSCEYAESKPTIPSNAASPPNVDVIQQRKILDHPIEDALSLMTHDPGYEIKAAAAQSHEEKRVRRDAPSNPCVTGHKLVLIDHEKVYLTVTCAKGCREIKRILFLQDREDPLVLPVNCVAKS